MRSNGQRNYEKKRFNRNTGRGHILALRIDNEELVGFGALSLIPLIHEDGYLARVSALAIRKSHQGKGVGKLLMNHIEEICRTKDCPRIELTSGAHRESTAHRFYQRIGYEKSTSTRFVKTLTN